MKPLQSAPVPRHGSSTGVAALDEAPRPAGAWLFGKLPAHGDFIGRGLEPTLRDALDGWLSAELARARGRFGDEFDERYRLASPWRFIDRDPSGAWSGGALCPSVDAVGRRFPIMVGLPANDAAAALAAAQAALDLVFAALGEGWEASRLLDALGAAEPPVSNATEPPAPGWAIEAEDGTVLELPGRFPDGLIERMLEIAE